MVSKESKGVIKMGEAWSETSCNHTSIGQAQYQKRPLQAAFLLETNSDSILFQLPVSHVIVPVSPVIMRVIFNIRQWGE